MSLEAKLKIILAMKMIIDEFEKAHQMPTLPNYFPSKSLFSIVKVTSNVQIIQNQRSTGKMYELSEFLRMIIIEHRHHRKKNGVYSIFPLLFCWMYSRLPSIFQFAIHFRAWITWYSKMCQFGFCSPVKSASKTIRIDRTHPQNMHATSQIIGMG